MNSHNLEEVQKLSNELSKLIERYKCATDHDEIFEVKKNIRQQIQEIERQLAEMRSAWTSEEC